MIRDFHDLSTEERDAHVAKWGQYNDFPPRWRRITEEEFARSAHFTFPPSLREYRQMIVRDQDGSITRPALSALLEYQHDGQTGFSIVADFWPGKVAFFKFGCDDAIHGANNVKCPSCGWHPQYDTSD